MMASNFTLFIPVRYQSTRLPGKPLSMINGKTMLEHVYRRCQKSAASRIVIATDSEMIAESARAFTSDIVMTSVECRTGTERISQAVRQLNLPESEIIVNVQGDEPLIQAENINQVAGLLAASHDAEVASLYQRIQHVNEVISPHSVKVLTDKQDRALCFSRGELPFANDRSQIETYIQKQYYKKHIGLYAYRASFLVHLDRFPPTYHEEVEQLEQMSWLGHGCPIQMAQAKQRVVMDVNTHEDLEKICQIWDELSVV